ncbi:MAG: hypothetical protein E7559_09575, partial [Ruminococcaceae bacterium]|nr:hypothetical protein [Oscillospiraceae bacterium]
MDSKYKVSQFAEDFGMAPKAMTELLKSNAPGERKYNASTQVTPEEFDLVMELLTAQHQVESFAEFEAEARPMQKAENIRIEEVITPAAPAPASE